MEENTSDWILFFGRFHPLVLHVPIGFLLLGFILEILSRFRRFHHFRAPVDFILVVGAGTAILTCVLGLMLARSGGYENDLLFVHQWSGIGVAVCALVAIAFRWLSRKNPARSLDRGYLLSMFIMVLTISIAGHYGGSLTHGSDYLTQHMPESLRMLTGFAAEEPYEKPVIENLDSAVLYTDIVNPILNGHCTSCHSQRKSKGDLMMHTPDAMLKGGENGQLFVAGNASRSLMIERILLPVDHDDHMPPKGKKQLSREDINLLRWWINEGASFDKTVSQVNIPDSIQSILDEFIAPGAGKSEVEILLASPGDPVDTLMLTSFNAKGIRIEPLSHEVHWLQVDVAPYVAGDSLLESLSPLSDNITWLNLAGTSTTDDGMLKLADFKHLTRLHIGNTSITDKGLSSLKDLSYLESLNLYGTRVSDNGIQQLSTLKNLRTLYLWKTDVTPEGATRLQKALPGVRINLGSDVVSSED